MNPKETLQIPSFITPDYFHSILRKDEPGYEQITKFSPKAAVSPGENFSSIMLRVLMELRMQDGSTKQKSYIVKTTLDDDKGGAFVRELSMFPKEREVYDKYIPAFEALYKAAGRNVQFSPKCVFTELVNGRFTFVFEDLSVKNFKNVNRLLGYDMEHMTRVLQKLAEFHAASVVFAEAHGPYPDMYNDGFLSRNEKVQFQKVVFVSKEKSFKKAMAIWGLEEDYIKKFPTFEQYSKFCKLTFDVNSNRLNVLTHGDVWSSNIMQNYHPDGSVDEVLLLDYQFCKWGSPVEDLLFVIIISAAKDIRFKKFDHFVQIYHEHLIECLRLLNYKKRLPKLRELHMEMYKENMTWFAFFAAFNHLLVVLLPSDNESNMENFLRTDEAGEQYRMRALTNPIFEEAMKDIFPFFHRRGMFEFE